VQEEGRRKKKEEQFKYLNEVENNLIKQKVITNQTYKTSIFQNQTKS